MLTMTISSDRDKLRLELGDRNVNDYIFTNDELDYFLDVESNDITRSKLRAARAAAAYFSREFDFETDGQKFARSQKAQAFKAIVDDLVAQGVTTSETSSASAFTSVSSTKVDGYSQSVANDEVSQSGTASVYNRWWGGRYYDLPY